MVDMSSGIGVQLGARIRALRTTRGYTIESFAQKLGFSWITVSRYERGKSTPNIDRLHHIAEVLDVSIEDLVSDSEHD
jgi:transcriptional regulator with XRE-family HTH domain